MRTKARNTYNGFPRRVYCATIKEYVYFNAEGFHHLSYDGLGHRRTIAETVHKLLLVPHIPAVLKAAKEVRHKRLRENGIGKIQKATEYWGISAQIQGIRIKVVLKRTGAGRVIFWSIMRMKSDK